MLRRCSIVLGVGLLLSTSLGALGAASSRFGGMTPVSDKVADEIAGGQAYCPQACVSADEGCGLSAPCGYCTPRNFYDGDCSVRDDCNIVVFACSVCGYNCGYCNCVDPCTCSVGL